VVTPEILRFAQDDNAFYFAPSSKDLLLALKIKTPCERVRVLRRAFG
jgi:hypothetical protein